MNTRLTHAGVAADRVRPGLRCPAPDTLVWLLLLVIAMIAASLGGLALGTL